MKTATATSMHLQSAKWVTDYIIRLTFTDKTEQLVNFAAPFARLRGYCARHREPEMFRQFSVDEGNIVWGENWDVIFLIHMLYNNSLR